MNFNINNQRTKFHIPSPIMRHFSTIGLVPSKPEPSEYILKPDYIFKNVQNSFFSTLHGNVLPNKSFSNPNFVNKQNPNILTPSIAGAIKLSNCHENLKPNSHTQQPKHDNYTHKHIGDSPKVYQPLPDKISSQNSPQPIVHKPELPTISTSNENTTNLSPKTTKKIRNRNRRNRKNAKRQKQDSISLEPNTEQKSNMTGKKNCKFNCSSPKKFKKSQESKQKSRKSNKKCKPWHKISFNKEFMECDEPITPDTAEMFESAPKDGFCLQIKSSPIEISPKCNGIVSETLSISISPCSEFLKNLSTSNSSSEVMSCSPSSPAIRRLRMPSECDSEDSFIVFCEDANDYLSEEISSDSEEETEYDSEEDSESDSDFDVGDFIKKTDLNRVPAKKKVTFACDAALCTVHPMVQWSYAYHAARRGQWEQIARDRSRFETRISNTGNMLNAILDPEHRAKVYRDRFQE